MVIDTLVSACRSMMASAALSDTKQLKTILKPALVARIVLKQPEHDEL